MIFVDLFLIVGVLVTVIGVYKLAYKHGKHAGKKETK